MCNSRARRSTPPPASDAMEEKSSDCIGLTDRQVDTAGEGAPSLSGSAGGGGCTPM
jgi:hypothetical protein